MRLRSSHAVALSALPLGGGFGRGQAPLWPEPKKPARRGTISRKRWPAQRVFTPDVEEVAHRVARGSLADSVSSGCHRIDGEHGRAADGVVLERDESGE